MIRLSSLRLAGLFLLSVALVAYELAVMRLFAVGSWSNFGTMVISIALLGYGIAGTVLTLLERRIAADPDPWLGWSAALLGPAMAAGQILAQLVPFNPVMIAADPVQLLWIGAYYLIYSLPFVIGSVFIGASFVAFGSRIHALYFLNMLGSGLGGFLVLGLLFVLPTERLVAPLVALAALGAFLAAVSRPRGSLVVLPARTLVAVLGLGLSLVGLALFGGIRVSEWKPVSYARDFPDARLVHRSQGPTGEYEVYQSSFFHLAPGLSDNASSGVAFMPVDAFLGLYVDGDGPVGIMRKLAPREEAYFDYLPMAAPYLLLREPRVLLLRLGGGVAAQAALHHGARSVTVVEPDPVLVGMLRDEPAFVKWTGGLLADPRVKVVGTEPRAFTAAGTEGPGLGARGTFDLAEISLVDSVGLSQTAGYPVVENYLYTVEGLASYLRRLSPGGFLSISVWNRLSPPRNVPKLLATVGAALKASGVKDPSSRLFVFDQLLSTATILVKNGAFEDREIAALRAFCARLSFVPCWYPGMPAPATSMEGVLSAYRDQLSADPRAIEAPDATGSRVGAGPAAPSPAQSGADFLQEDLYYWTVVSVSGEAPGELLDRYVLSVAPATDDRPYYTGYVKPSGLATVARNIRDLSEEWGYLLLVATLALSACAGLLIVLVPMIARRRELFARKKGTFRVILYFASLGVGYMLLEIFLIQRLTFFLVDPIFSNSIVITTMLASSGLGGLAAGSSRRTPVSILGLAVLGIVLSCAFYVFLLPPLVNGLLGLGLGLKILVSVLLVAPAAFCLGIPFPLGLSGLARTRPGLVPWAWGVNGALSVTGAVLARLVSVSAGFSVVLALAAGIYVLARLVFSGTIAEEREDKARVGTGEDGEPAGAEPG